MKLTELTKTHKFVAKSFLVSFIGERRFFYVILQILIFADLQPNYEGAIVKSKPNSIVDSLQPFNPNTPAIFALASKIIFNHNGFYNGF